jgi:hypothetical protein
MQGKKEYVKAQLVGLKVLPEESGLWGVLLPRPGDKAVTHEPLASEDLETLSPEVLRFANRDVDGMNRAYGLFLGSSLGTLLALGITPTFFRLEGKELDHLIHIGLASLLLLSFVFGLGLWAYRSARSPMAEPIVLARKPRRFFLWTGKKAGWQSWAYDELVPFTQTHTVVTTAGASTGFTLRLALIDPKTREFIQVINPAPIQRTPEACGQLWEFIRRYMDQPPEALPPVRLQPDLNDPAADLARFDRRFGGFITPDHRIAPGILPKLFFAFWAVVDYWQMRAMAWIQRTAPRPIAPPELAQALRWTGTNPYRFTPLTADEALAWKGQLPRQRLRWRVVQFFATVLWGGLFLFMAWGFLSGAMK